MIRINLARPKTRDGLDAVDACFEHAERWSRAGDSFAWCAEYPYLSLTLEERFAAVENAFRCLELCERWEGRARELFGRVLEGWRRDAA